MASRRPDEVSYLTGRLSGTPRPSGIALLDKGGKFTPDGAVQHWPGNTFICHIDQSSAAFEAMRELQEGLKKSEFSRFFTFLPPPSLHMTVYQGISPDATVGNGWPENLPEHLPRDEATARMLDRLADLSLPNSFRIRVDGLFSGYSLTVSGADDGEEAKLRAARATLRDATGINFTDFDDYVFHITLAYLIDWMSEATTLELLSFSAEIGGRFQNAIGEIDLGPVEFCNFDTMHHFELVRALK